MRIAVIENKLKDYIINVFHQHSNLDLKLVGFLDWKPQQDAYLDIPVGKIEDLYHGQYDAVLIAVKENRYLSRLLTYLHKKHIQNVYVVRLFVLDMQEDFLREAQPMKLDGMWVDRMPEGDEKPYLVHLETHVCDHCNLNCKACNNFSPFVKEPTYADIGQFERDLKRLTELFSGIGRFFLLGGEPLLAPELCCDMIRCFRKYFPTNELRVLTNATLILSMKDVFWNCLRENDVIIHISLYPPVKERIDEIRQRLEEERIKYLVSGKVETFVKRWTAYPFEDEKYNNEQCRSAGCHYLRNGEISKCPDAILAGFMAEGHEGMSGLRLNDRVKLAEETDAWRLIERVDGPNDMCKNCTYKRIERIQWERAEEEAQLSDWLLPHRYEAEVERLKCISEKQNEEIVILNQKSESLNQNINVLNEKIKSKDSELEENKNRISLYEKREMGLEKELNIWKQKCDDANSLLKEVQQEYERIKNSYSNKIGRFVTWLPRKIRQIVKYILGGDKKKADQINKIGRYIIENSHLIQIKKNFNKIIMTGFSEYSRVILSDSINMEETIYFMDYSGTGDAYLSCCFLKSNGLVDNAFFVGSGMSTNIALYFGFKDIINIPENSGSCIRIMDRFSGGNCILKPLLYESVPLIYSGVLRYLQGMHKLDFLTMLRIGWESNLNIPYSDNYMWQEMRFPYKLNLFNEILYENVIQKGKTVILAPYMRNGNLYGVTMDFWKRIAGYYRKKGFLVLTNLCSNQKEYAVPETKPIFIAHEFMVPLLEYAGYFISVRSGLCDIIASAHCKKIIIYPDKKVVPGIGSWLSFFSLNEMGLSTDALEYEYSIQNEDMLIKKLCIESNVF